MTILEKQQTLLLSHKIKAINKALPYELIVDIFDGLTVEAFTSNFYPSYIRDKFSTDSKGEMVKEHNTATKNTKGPFEKWSECIKNWLSSSAIVYNFEHETFKKRHVFIQTTLKKAGQKNQMSNKQLLQTAKEQALQSIEVLEEMIKERDEKLNLKDEKIAKRDEQIKLKDERIAKLEKHVLLSSQAKFVCNENSFFKAEFSNQGFYYAGQPFKRITDNFFGVQYFEVTLDISKYKSIGLINYDFMEIHMYNEHENEVKIKYIKVNGTGEKEFIYPFTPSNLFTAGCGMVTSPTNDLFDKPRTFVFFTVNGQFIGNAISLDEDVEELIPTFTLSEEYADVKTNFGEKAFLFKLDTNFIETLLKF